MKLPGRMFMPCRNQMHPTRRHRTPTTVDAIRMEARVQDGAPAIRLARAGHTHHRALTVTARAVIAQTMTALFLSALFLSALFLSALFLSALFLSALLAPCAVRHSVQCDT